MTGLYLVGIGTLVVILAKIMVASGILAASGLGLTFAGLLLTAPGGTYLQFNTDQVWKRLLSGCKGLKQLVD